MTAELLCGFCGQHNYRPYDDLTLANGEQYGVSRLVGNYWFYYADPPYYYAYLKPNNPKGSLVCLLYVLQFCCSPMNYIILEWQVRISRPRCNVKTVCTRSLHLTFNIFGTIRLTYVCKVKNLIAFSSTETGFRCVQDVRMNPTVPWQVCTASTCGKKKPRRPPTCGNTAIYRKVSRKCSVITNRKGPFAACLKK